LDVLVNAPLRRTSVMGVFRMISDSSKKRLVPLYSMPTLPRTKLWPNHSSRTTESSSSTCKPSFS
jgi:hypothetical protein